MEYTVDHLPRFKDYFVSFTEKRGIDLQKNVAAAVICEHELYIFYVSPLLFAEFSSVLESFVANPELSFTSQHAVSVLNSLHIDS